MEIGVTTFADSYPLDGRETPHGRRLREVIEEIEVAERAGLQIYGVGEHHRKDFAASAPAVVLATAAGRTSKIILTSAVTVLSSEDPVRVFQQFTTLDLLSEGRAEIIAGRGSFIESFPLFGFDLADYDELFSEKLDLLVRLTEQEQVTWRGSHRGSLDNQTVYPRPERRLPVWVGVGGNPESVVRAAAYGLPMALAIIGGEPRRFAPLIELYRKALKEAGQESKPVAVHAHGFVGEPDDFYPAYARAMTVIGRERGWGPMTRAHFDQMRGPEGSLVLGDPDQVAEKIVAMRRTLGIERFMLHISVGTLPHEQVLRSIELLGTEVAPRVAKLLEGEGL